MHHIVTADRTETYLVGARAEGQPQRAGPAEEPSATPSRSSQPPDQSPATKNPAPLMLRRVLPCAQLGLFTCQPLPSPATTLRPPWPPQDPASRRNPTRPLEKQQGLDEAASALGVSPLTVYRLVNSGDLAAYRISRRFIRIDETALRTYLVGHAIGAGGITDRDIDEQHILPAWQ